MDKVNKIDVKNKSYLSYFMIPVIYILIFTLEKINILNGYWYQLIMLAIVNGIMAMSLNLINGITGQFSLGHAGFMSVGAYTAALLTTKVFKTAMSVNVFTNYGLFIIALFIGGLAAATIGLFIGIPSLKLKGDYLAIITLGFSEIIRTVWRVTKFTNGAKGLSGVPKLSNFTVLYFALILVMFALRNFTNSNYGRSCIAIRENELAAETMGINITIFKIKSFIFSAFIAGIGGGLFAHLIVYIQPNMFSQAKSTDFLLYLYAGGVGSYTSALLGASIFTVLPELLRFMGEWRLVVYALVMIIIMLKRPKGIFGKYEFGFMKLGEEYKNITIPANNGLLERLKRTFSKSKIEG